ncbi:MAG: hypothetical protein R3B89_15010 [Polyangiaceae bacterium]
MTKLKLKRHALHDFYAEGEVARDRERWMATGEVARCSGARFDPRRPGDTAPLQRRSANKMLLIEDVQSFCGFLSASVDYAVAGFRLWYAPGEVDVELCGQTLRLPGAIPGLGDPRDWWYAVACAKILRRAEAVQSPLRMTTRSSSGFLASVMGINSPLAAALRDFWLDSPDFDADATDTHEQSAPGVANYPAHDWRSSI